MSQSSKSAIVVGSGLVGSLWTVFLARRGYKVKVFERRPDMRSKGYIGGRSINLAMSERGWKAVERAGIRNEIEKVAIPMPGRMMHSTDSQLTFQPYGLEDQAIYSVSRGGLNLELLRIADTFPEVELYFNHRCLEVDTESPVVRFLDETTGEEKEIEAPLIFGTDGAFSAVRSTLQRTDRFDFRQRYLSHGYKELHIPPTEEGGFRMDKNALHIWPRGHFMLIALPNADGSFTCTLFLPWEGDDSFEQLNSREDVQQFFERYFPDTIDLMPTLHEDFEENPTSSLVTINCNPWQYQNRILLIGDAAHAIVPFYGQGMNAGFEDCTILDEMIDAMDHDWDRIIPEFAKQRQPDGDAIAELALRNFIEMRDWVGDPKFLLRKKIAGFLHDKYPEFLPVYSMVSFSDIPYSKAWEEVAAQDALFERILSLPEAEARWNGPEVEAVFKEWLANR